MEILSPHYPAMHLAVGHIFLQTSSLSKKWIEIKQQFTWICLLELFKFKVAFLWSQRHLPPTGQNYRHYFDWESSQIHCKMVAVLHRMSTSEQHAQMNFQASSASQHCHSLKNGRILVVIIFTKNWRSLERVVHPSIHSFVCSFIYLYLFSHSDIDKPFKAPQTAKSANVTEFPARKATGARLLFKRWRASLILPAFSREFTLNSSQWST